MHSTRRRPAGKRNTGPRSPKSILVAQYSLLISIGTGIACITYFSIAGPEEKVNVIGNTINVTTVHALDAIQIKAAITNFV